MKPPPSKKKKTPVTWHKLAPPRFQDKHFPSFPLRQWREETTAPQTWWQTAITWRSPKTSTRRPKILEYFLPWKMAPKRWENDGKKMENVNQRCHHDIVLKSLESRSPKRTFWGHVFLTLWHLNRSCFYDSKTEAKSQQRLWKEISYDITKRPWGFKKHKPQSSSGF